LHFIMAKHRCLANVFSVILAAGVLVGCAAVPGGHKDPRDPWERMNRATNRFNDGFVRKVAIPVGKAYQRVTRGSCKQASQTFTNLSTPSVIVNDLLQVKVKTGLNDTGAFFSTRPLGSADY